MIDYSQNAEERENFILNYNIEGDTIIVNFANKDNHAIPNTKGNLEKLEKMMEYQVTKAEENDFDKKHKKHAITITIASVAAVAVISIASITLSKHINPNIINPIFWSLFTITTITSGVLVGNEIMKLYDFQKNIEFKKNREKINKGLTNNNVLSNASVNVQNIVEDQQQLTYSDLDGLTKKDITSVKVAAAREEYFGFDEFELEEEQPKEEQPSKSTAKKRIRRR